MFAIVDNNVPSRHHIVLVTHAPRGSRIGNRVTALRWAAFLRRCGARVRIVAADYTLDMATIPTVVILLHARRCAALMQRCWTTTHHPWQHAAWIIALTGTDIYGGWPNDQELAFAKRHLDGVIALQDDMKNRLPEVLQARTAIIYQSAKVLPAYNQPHAGLRFLVSGHLRREKNPFAALRALQQLPTAKVQVDHCGGEIEHGFIAQAQQWQQHESRYVYRGELSRAQATESLRRSDVLINASLQEGCPAIVVEAMVAGVAVFASAISAHCALLGEDYPGLFGAEDDAALARLIDRAQSEPDFLAQLRLAVQQRATRFTPENEAQHVITFINAVIAAKQQKE